MPQQIVSRFLAAIFAAGALIGPLSTPAAGATFYVDVNNAQCSDAPTFGTEARPYCSLRYVATIAKPGDTFLFKNGRYGQGGTFTESGTATAPITYKAIGNNVSIGTFEDVRDEDFVATQYPHVYSVNWTKPCCVSYRITQNYFDPILVDDPANPSIFTIKQEDGPMQLSAVGDYTTLSAHEGTWFYESGKIYVHPYNDRTPSTSGTDLVVGHALDGKLLVDAQYNIFDGFTLNYGGGGGTPSFTVLGSFNKFLNLKFQTLTFYLLGNNNYAENISMTHVITRDKTWGWYNGDGSAMALYGTGHVLKNLHIFHNWNSSISGEHATGVVIDGLRMHGAPNHCGSVSGKNNVLRNAVIYNCQDYFFIHETDNVVIEHTVNPYGIALQGMTKPIGKVTVRNSILNGNFGYTTQSKPEYCQWESGSLMENNIISTASTIERCADGKAYPILEYIAKCESGEFTGCMTIRNNRMVSDFKKVIKDGMWNAALGDTWDVSLVAGSPAIDAGTISGTRSDFSGTARPQGRESDSGMYEFCPGGVCDPSPPHPLIPTLLLNLPPALPLNAQISATYSGGAPAVYYAWTFSPVVTPKTSARALAAGTIGQTQALTAHFTTPRPQADLGSAHLGFGPYLVSVSVFDVNNHAFGPAQATVTLTSGDPATIRVYPNPWRKDVHDGRDITFTDVSDGVTIKIFTVSGHWVKTLARRSPSTTWDLTNHAGDKVASGMYLYLLTTESGQKKSGQLIVIK